MAPIDKKCSACRNKLPKNEFLKCGTCGQLYDLLCTSVSAKRFYLMTSDNKKNWRCQLCVNKLSKTNNIKTPSTRSSFGPNTSDSAVHVSSASRAHITERRKQTNRISDNDESAIDDQLDNDETMSGDTLCSQISNSPPKASPELLTIHKISELLDEKLGHNEKKMLSLIKSELRSLIQEEIQNAITNLKLETASRFDNIYTEQNIQKTKIDSLTKHIELLEREYNQIKNDIKDINNRSSSLPNQDTIFTSGDNSRKLVLYGLIERKWENENELHNRVLNVFAEILHLNLDGYIEGLTRLGKLGHRRPIVIELISKRITTQALKNKHFFNRTGLAISAFLDKDILQERKKLRKLLQEARNEGHHAIIRNNKLLINGEEQIAITKHQEQFRNPTKITEPTHATSSVQKTSKINKSFRN